MSVSPLLLLTSSSSGEQAAWRDALTAAMPDETVVTVEDGFDRGAVEVAIIANPHPGALDRLPNLKWAQSLWAGVDRLAKDPTLPNVPVVRLVDPTLARAMAETVSAVALGFHRDLDVYAAQQRDGVWLQHPTKLTYDRRVTVLGLGEMGRTTAELLSNIGFNVRGWSRSGVTLGSVDVHAGRAGFDVALQAAEILVNLLPLTPETRGVLNARAFSRLAPGACLINFARGEHLVEPDLLDALASGQLRRAVVDVFAQEPLPATHPFWGHPGVTVLPHVAARTNRSAAATIVAAAVASYRQSGRVPVGFDRSRGY